MASTYLSKSISTTGDEQKFTISTWVKRSALSDNGIFISGSQSTETGYFAIYFSGNAIRVRFYEGSAKDVVTSALYRDTSAWYHIVVKVDTTQSTAADRVIIYVNGEEQNKSSATYVTQNFNTLVNTSGETHVIGATRNSSGVIGNQFDGSITHFHLIDGTAYTASTFGETDSTSGIWKPKVSPSVTYGTNGFFLKFQDSSSLGDDSSGNTNDFTLSGSGTQTLDTPSNVFATWNRLANTGLSLQNGNTYTVYASNDHNCKTTLGMNSGKYYWEMKPNGVSGTVTGICRDTTKQQADISNTSGQHVYAIQYASGNVTSKTNGTFGASTSWGTYVSGDILQYAYDADNGKLFIGKNGTYKDLSGNTGDPANGTNPTFSSLDTTATWFPFVEGRGGSENNYWNFGNGYFGTTAVSSAENDGAGYGKFEYSPPTGFYALCTKNINTYG